jgi:hypothetical protein
MIREQFQLQNNSMATACTHPIALEMIRESIQLQNILMATTFTNLIDSEMIQESNQLQNIQPGTVLTRRSNPRMLHVQSKYGILGFLGGDSCFKLAFTSDILGHPSSSGKDQQLWSQLFGQ